MKTRSQERIRDRTQAIILVPVLWGVVVCGAFAQSEESGSLRGVQGVEVVIAALEPDFAWKGPSRSDIQADIEQRLHRVGIPVLAAGEGLKAPNGSILSITVNTLKSGLPWYAIAIHVSLRQRMVLQRNTAVQLLAPTWLTHAVAMVGEQQLWKLRGYIIDEVDKFIHTYTAQHSP